MRWLLHGNLTPAVGDALRRHGHTASLSADAQIDSVEADDVLDNARAKQLDIVTADADLMHHALQATKLFDRSIVFLQLDGEDVEQDDAIDRLFKRYKRLTPGRLYTVTNTRVKIRQLPGK